MAQVFVGQPPALLTVEPHESQVEEPSQDGGRGYLSLHQENKCLGRKFPSRMICFSKGNIFLSYFLRETSQLSLKGKYSSFCAQYATLTHRGDMPA